MAKVQLKKKDVPLKRIKYFCIIYTIYSNIYALCVLYIKHSLHKYKTNNPFIKFEEELLILYLYLE